MAVMSTGTGDVFDPDKTPGSFGAPPLGAPMQIADNSAAGLAPTAEQIAQARASEQVLAPLTYADSVAAAASQAARPALVYGDPPAPGSAPPSVLVGLDHKPLGAPPVELNKPVPVVTSSFKAPDVPRNRRLRPVIITPQEAGGHDPGTVADGAGPVDHGLGVVGAPAGAAGPSAPIELGIAPKPSGLAAAARMLHESDLRSADSDEPYRPAASNSDSPARGLPQPVADAGKRITGGFGDVGEAQYFPLDGMELRGVAEQLLDQLRARLRDDLRFSIAVTYPRVAIRLELIIDAFGQDKEQVIPAVAVPHTATPLEIARQYGDQIVFILAETRREFDADGQPDQAPNAMRMAAGLETPYKRPVALPGGQRIMVDRG